jgi:exonuclease SbcD
MRLLHVSDWHVGRVSYGVSRAEDHDAVLAEIIGIARDTRPDLVLHTGDLFDNVRPAVEDMRRATAALQDLAMLAPVAVLAGNHDSPALFRLFNALLGGVPPGQPAAKSRAAPIRFVDKARGGPAGILRYPVATPHGEQVIRVAPLPFVRDGLIVDTMEDPATWLRAYTDRVRAMESALGLELAAGFDPSRDVNVFAAHLYVGGSTFHRSEKPIHITDVYATTVDAIPRSPMPRSATSISRSRCRAGWSPAATPARRSRWTSMSETRPRPSSSSRSSRAGRRVSSR